MTDSTIAYSKGSVFQESWLHGIKFPDDFFDEKEVYDQMYLTGMHNPTEFLSYKHLSNFNEDLINDIINLFREVKDKHPYLVLNSHKKRLLIAKRDIYYKDFKDLLEDVIIKKKKFKYLIPLMSSHLTPLQMYLFSELIDSRFK